MLSGHKTLIAFFGCQGSILAPPFPLGNYPSFSIQSIKAVTEGGQPSPHQTRPNVPVQGFESSEK